MTARRHSFGGAAVRKGAFGRRADNLRVGRTVQLLNLTKEDRLFAENPALIQVAIGFRLPVAAWVDRLEVVAELRWTSGHAALEAEIDVPARGAIVTIGGADGLTVNARADGDAASTLELTPSAIASVAVSSQPKPATRTRRVTLPAQSGTLFEIPAFARGFRCIGDAPVLMANTRLRYHDDPAGGTTMAETVLDEGAFAPVPVGATHFALIDAASNYVASILWELAL